MIDEVRTFLDNLVQNLRPADFIDVALVAIFLYVLISWVRLSTTRGTLQRIGVILLVFSAVYLPARFLEMHLIGRVAEVFLVVLLLAVIVVFQSDLRRMLDQAGSWIFSGSSSASPPSPADELIEAVAHMADEKTGALIALRGNEPWERHIQGGVVLGGALSPPLLYSLFDHRTPGHDGALLMEGDQIVRFAAHLPLADEETEASRYGGTRHAAALGLSTRCDAFVIVVSEERGTISIARDGQLREVSSPESLKEELESFWREHYAEETGKARSWTGKRSLQTAAFSIVLACALWLVFAYSPGTIYRSFEVPIEYRNVPDEWMLQDGEQWADVTVSGPEQAFRLFDPERLAIGLSMEDLEQGWNEFTVDRGDLDLPAQLTLEVVQPQTIRINARPMRRARLPITVPTEGTLPEALQLARLEAEPDSVTVLVLEEATEYSEIATEPVDLSEILENTSVQRALVLATNMRFLPDGETEVEVHIDVEPEDEESEEDPE